MLIKLQRNTPKSDRIDGTLFIDGELFCQTIERVGFQILPLWYRVAVTNSPKFKRMLPILYNVPNRTGIRIHRGTKPQHSTGCILVPPDKENELTERILNAQKQHEEIRMDIQE